MKLICIKSLPAALLSASALVLLAVGGSTTAKSQGTYAVCQTNIAGSSAFKSSPTSSSISCTPATSSEPNYFSTTVSASSRATYGVLGATGTGSDIGLAGSSGFGYLAQGSFNDTFTFTTATPQAGEVTLRELSSGSAGYGGSGSYHSGEYEGYGNYTFVSGALETAIDGTGVFFTLGNGSTPTSQSYAFSAADFVRIGGGLYQYSGTIGETLTVSGSCIADVGSCNVYTDYYDTAQVTGLDFTNTAGSTMSGTLTTGSGTDYNAISPDTPSAVTPEPSSLMLLSTGAACIAGALRRKFATKHKICAR